ncbi:MAG: hypothetical protein KJP21_01630, partial [Bacteroidia bacterium]|nr:hypothetical protein [Bacteroidia bacterium]
MIVTLLIASAITFYSCKDEESTTPQGTTEDPRLAKRQMHFTFLQYQNSNEDSMVSGAVLKMYKNFSDFDADTAIVLTGT